MSGNHSKKAGQKIERWGPLLSCSVILITLFLPLRFDPTSLLGESPLPASNTVYSILMEIPRLLTAHKLGTFWGLVAGLVAIAITAILASGLSAIRAASRESSTALKVLLEIAGIGVFFSLGVDFAGMIYFQKAAWGRAIFILPHVGGCLLLAAGFGLMVTAVWGCGNRETKKSKGE